MRTGVEFTVGGRAPLDSVALITSGAFEVVLISGPAIWVALAAIAAVSIVINMVEDPATLTWARQCSFGTAPEADYKGNPSLEQKDFREAMVAS